MRASLVRPRFVIAVIVAFVALAAGWIDGARPVVGRSIDPDGTSMAAGGILNNYVSAESSAASCAPPAAGLIAWWPGEGNAEDAGPQDPSGTFDGTTYGPEPPNIGLAYTTGKVGQAFDFDGVDDGILLPQTHGLQTNGDMTISAWIRFTDAHPNGGVIYQNNGGPPVQMLYIEGTHAGFFYRGYNSNFVSLADLRPNVSVNDGAWHHVAGVRSGDIGNLYVDGVLAATATVPDVGIVGHAYQWARIGAGRSDGQFDQPSNESWFKGQIDEVELYGRALSAAEIAEQATCGPCAPVPDDMVAWWPFDEADGTSASDIAGGHHDLTLGPDEVWHPAGSSEPGRVRGAIEFSGISADPTVADAPALRFGTGDFSIQFWIKLPAGDVPAAFGVLQKRGWNNGNAGVGSYGVIMRNNRYELQIARTAGGQNYFYPASAVVVTGVWQHVAITVDRDDEDGDAGVRFYINGTFVTMVSAADPMQFILPPLDVTNTAPILFGSASFMGMLDEVELFDRALDADEVAATYAAGAAGHCLPGTSPCADLCELDARVTALEACPSACALDLRLQAAESTVPVLQAQVATLQGQVSALEAKVAALGGVEARLAALEDKLQHVSRTGTELTISGANLHVVNGTGATNGVPNGLGNVIVGYNEPRPGGGDPRTGSHMVVVGRGNGYSSYGGIVVGENNTTGGVYASISGGSRSIAAGPYASVSGGSNNSASGVSSSICGGVQGKASGEVSTVAGGANNRAIGTWAAVSGGAYNDAIGTWSSVGGGYGSTAVGASSTVGGGFRNVANGSGSTVSGGANRSTTAGQQYAWRGGNLIQKN